MRLSLFVASLLVVTAGASSAPLRAAKFQKRGLLGPSDPNATVPSAVANITHDVIDYGGKVGDVLQGKEAIIDPARFNLPSRSDVTGEAVLQSFAQVLGGPGPAPVANLTQGNYIGLRSFPILQQEMFLGIPFAAPPVGNLRFASPQPLVAQPAREFLANQLPASCWQPNDYLIHFNNGDTVNRRDEDCLTLNVYAPAGTAGSSKRLPVLFWLFGGGEIGGSANSYNGTGLVLQSVQMGQPMLVVTPQYRLNSFGFLAGVQPTGKVDGSTLNAGMQDITASLNWVKDNIAAFGGDPNRITIAGQSSGAFNTAAQLLKDGAPGAPPPVYRAAVMLSGTAMSEPAPSSDSGFAEFNFQRIAGAVGCGGAQATIACLRGVAPEALAQATFWPSTTVDPSQAFIHGPYYLAGTQPFQLTRDGVYHRDGAGAQIGRGEVPDVPILTGNVKDEGTLFSSQEMNADNVASNLATVAFPDKTLAGTGTMIERWLQVYKDDPNAGAPYYSSYNKGVSRFGPGNQFERISSILGDNGFVSKRRYMINNWLKYKKSAVYSYLFDESVTAPDPNNWVGVCHGCDVGSWFGQYAFAPKFEWLPATVASSFASASLVAFVNNMDPNHNSLPVWPRYDAQTRQIMKIDGLPNVITDDYRSEMNDMFTTPETFNLMTT